MAWGCENGMIQIKDKFQIVAKWLQFSTEEYINCKETTPSYPRQSQFHQVLKNND